MDAPTGQETQTVVAEPITVDIQEVPAKLIDHDEDDQSGAIAGLGTVGVRAIVSPRPATRQQREQ